MKRFLTILISLSLALYTFPIPQAKALTPGMDVHTIWALDASATAGNVNGGGFNPSNANFLTDLDFTNANTSSPVASSTSYSFAAGDAGAWIYIKTGTNFYADCWYNIASVSLGKATLTAGAGTAVCRDSTQGYPTPRFIANANAGVASVASPTGATWGLDFSQGTTARRTWAAAGGDFTNDLACTNVAQSVCTSASYTFQAIDVGNIIHVTAGTNATTTVTGALWAEIVSVAAGAATLDHNITTAAANMTSATAREGGAMSLNSTLDDDFFEAGGGTNGTGAMRYMMKNGTYSIGEPISISAGAIGGTQAPITIEGFNTLRGDVPTGANRPLFSQAASAIVLTSNWDLYNLQFQGSASTVISTGGNDKIVNVKFTNYSTTATRVAVQTSTNTYMDNVEAISYRGRAIVWNTSGTGGTIRNCYIHDSDTGIRFNSTGLPTISNCIIAGNDTVGLQVAGASTSHSPFQNITLYGAENKLGSGMTIASGATLLSLYNSIVYGFATGTVHSDIQTVGFDDYNDYNNNTVDVSNWQKGSHDLALNPTFTSVLQFTGTGATSSTNTLFYPTGGFNGKVTDGNSWVYLSSGSGTGFATGAYPVSAHTDTTLTFADPIGGAMNITSSGAGSAIAFQFTYGTGTNNLPDFSVGTNLKAQGFPGAFPGTNTTSYTDVGAVQRVEPAGGVCTAVNSYVCVGD